MDTRDLVYSSYDNEIAKLLFHVLEANYKLDVNYSTLGLTNGNIKIIGSGSIATTSAHQSFPILTHRPTIYNKINIIKRSKVIFLAPFANDVWLMLAFVLLAVTVALTYVLARELRLSDNSETGSRSKIRWELSEMLLVSIGALCQQGTTLNPQAPSSRTLFLAIFVMAALVYTAYNASIISIAESFVSSGTVVSTPLSLYIGDRPNFNFKNQDEEKLKELCSNDDNLNINRTPSSQVLIKVLEGSAILLADQLSTRDIFHRHCQSMKKLCKVKETFFTMETYRRVWILSHDKYKRLIDRSLLRFREFGLFDRTKRMIFKSWPLCEAHGACCGEAVSIYLDDVYPAFYLLFAGIGLSLILLSMELLFFQCSKFFKRKRNIIQKIRPSQERWSRLKDAIFCMASTTKSKEGSNPRLP